MENLGVDPKLLLAQLINFGLFFFIFSKFVAKPFLGYITEERKKDAERQKLAEVALRQQEELQQKEKEMRLKLKKEHDQAIDQVKKDVEKLKNDLVREANNDAQEILSKAEKQIKEERILMENEIRQKLATLTTSMVEHGLKDYLTQDMQKGINERILTSLKREQVN